jgi:hypothetical protein
MNKKMISVSMSKQYVKPIEQKDKQRGFMKWGLKNDYPFFLIELLYGSAWHQGILKNKTYYISGGGLEVVSGDATKFLANVFSDFDMNEIVQRLTFDFELFGGMCIKGTWNREGSAVAKWEYIPIDMGRLSEDERILFLSDDWSAMRQTPEDTNFRQLTALDERNPEGSFFIYYKEPAKQARDEKGIYPKPPYMGGITAIQTDVDISKFHMYEIQNGFKAGTLINLASGEPETAEEERRIKEQIKGRTQSVEDAGEIIITFSNGTQDAPSVLSLTGNDLDERYAMTEKSVQQNILVAHSVVAPSLFGIAPTGSFNAAETADLFEIYKMTYVNSRQKQIEWLINYMAKLSGTIAQLKLVDVSPIAGSEAAAVPEVAPVQASDDTIKMEASHISSLVSIASKIKEGLISQDSALQIIMASFPTIDEAQARKIVGLPSQMLSACSKDHSFSVDELQIFSEYGADASEYRIIKSTPIEWDTPSAEVFSNESMIFATVGELVVQLADLDKNILTLLKDGQDGPAIAEATGKTIGEVAQVIDKLVTLEIYKTGEVTSLGENVLENIEAPISQYEVRYSYLTRIDVPPVKTTSRPFCERLMDLNRLYSRQEIEQISSRVDRDVWRYRGGWYTNPDTGVSTPFCRHIWNQQLVIKR